MSNALQPHGLQHVRPPCPSPTPGVYSNSCLLSQWCHPNISTSVTPFSSWNIHNNIGFSSRNIHSNIFEFFWRTKALTQVVDGNFQLSPRFLGLKDNQLTNQKKATQPAALLHHHQILPIKTSPQTIGEFRVLEHESTHSPCLALQHTFLCSKLQQFGLFGLTVSQAHELVFRHGCKGFRLKSIPNPEFITELLPQGSSFKTLSHPSARWDSAISLIIPILIPINKTINSD